MAGFERTDAKLGVAIHHAVADQRGHVAHAAPRVRGGALQPQVFPGVESARRVRRHHGKGVEHDGQIEPAASAQIGSRSG